MSPLQVYSSLNKLLLLYLFLLFITSTASISVQQTKSYDLYGKTRRLLLDSEHYHQVEPIIKKKATSTIENITKTSTKNQTKLIKPSSTSSKNQTKLIKAKIGAFKNQTKLINKTPSVSNSAKNNKTNLVKTTSSASIKEPTLKSQLKKLNSTSKSSLSTKKSSDLPKFTPSKNKTSKVTKPHLQNSANNESKRKNPDKAKNKNKPTSILDQEDEEEDDFVSEFMDLPSKFQETFVPDLEKLHETSKIYLKNYNKQFIKNFKQYVGDKYASTIASFISFAFIIIPLIVVSLIFDKITAYFSIQKILIFIQAYLAIYFTILGLSTLVTGLEPLRYFYSASESTYVCVQLLQTLGYVLYLLLLLMYLIVVFSTETGLVTKLLGLGQTLVGLAVGLHYYISVFHRAVMHQPPKTNWKAHCLYATCFVVICWLGRIDRRKKAYLEEGGEEGKMS